MDASAPSSPPAPLIDSSSTNEIYNNAKTPPPSNVPIESPSLQDTPSTPRPSTPDSVSVPRPNLGPIYSAVYSGVPVYEFLVREVAVMRRRPDSYLNATQILKVAGLEKGKRTKIIEKEVLTGEHEKVQGGYGKYQGTWVPYERGKELAEQYGVLELLRPLLEYKPPKHDIPYSSSPYTPTKEQAMAAMRRQAARATNSSSQSTSQASALPSTQPHAVTYGNDIENVIVTPSEVSEPLLTAAEMDEGERHRNVLMAIFLNEDPNQIPDLLSNPSSPDEIDYDVVIDNHGHTALHWAAALARLQVMELLLERGANVKQLNYEGESALVRAVLVTNNFEAQNFPSVLDLLRETIPLTDKDNRTVFHHISMTSGTKGHSAAAKYYMDCIQQWVAQNVQGNISSILNIQDKNGDTALNIAARVGNSQLVRQLIEMGASKQIENKIGLKAIDFDPTERIEFEDLNDGRLDASTDYYNQPITSNFVNPRRKSRDVALGIQKLIDDAETEWIEQLRSKDEKLIETRRQCSITSRQLLEAKNAINFYQKQENELIETEEYIEFLEKVLNAEDLEDSFVANKRQKIEHSNGETSALDVLSTVSTSIPAPITGLHQSDTNASDPSSISKTSITDINTSIPISQGSTLVSPVTNSEISTTTREPPKSSSNDLGTLSQTSAPLDSLPSMSNVISLSAPLNISTIHSTPSSSTRILLNPPNSQPAAEKPPTITISPPSAPSHPSLQQTLAISPSMMPYNDAVVPEKSASEELIENEIRNLIAQINAYAADEDLLRQEIESLRKKSLDSIMKYKRIIASFCKIDLDKVDDYVETILSNDTVDFDEPRIKDLMNRVRNEEEMEDSPF
ncbi:5321_t:CDS:2 [Acaulospora morrowiae]|uniref:5321_t:CDS:1 n=1 Tax=Acaulospora morrowiae TaxID=94023 RepID=A0A9N9A780_9GLOM|nr:5321_t:CDS:2 [Acaulospora morrowiae]